MTAPVAKMCSGDTVRVKLDKLAGQVLWERNGKLIAGALWSQRLLGGQR